MTFQNLRQKQDDEYAKCVEADTIYYQQTEYIKTQARNKQVRHDYAIQQLLPEPSDGIIKTTIKIILPSGARVCRSFNIKSHLHQLFMFLQSIFELDDAFNNPLCMIELRDAFATRFITYKNVYNNDTFETAELLGNMVLIVQIATTVVDTILPKRVEIIDLTADN